MFKKAAILICWGVFSPLMIVFSLLSLVRTNTTVKADNVVASSPVYRRQVLGVNSLTYASLPQTQGEINSTVKSEDARTEILHQYLKERNSPLAPFAELFVNESDKNGIDFRLPVAIAECESNLCTENKFPEDSYNCWGYGIHSRGTLKFPNFDEAITKVIAGLKKFKDRGYLTSTEKLMELYTPGSIAKGGSWAKCVNHFMDKLD